MAFHSERLVFVCLLLTSALWYAASGSEALTLCDARTLLHFCQDLLSSGAAAGGESGGSGFFFGFAARLVRILVSQPGIEPWVPAVKAPSPNRVPARKSQLRPVLPRPTSLQSPQVIFTAIPVYVLQRG